MGCAASTAAAQPSHAGHPPLASTVAVSQRRQPHPASGAGQMPPPRAPPGQQQQQQRQQGPPPPAPETMRSAPLVRSLVSLHRGKCAVERDNLGSHFRVTCMAAAPGEAVAYFRALPSKSSDPLEELSAEQVSRQRFDAGPAQCVRLFLCYDEVQKALEGFSDTDGKHQLVVDLRADSSDASCITVQRSVFKFTEDGEGVQLTRQFVQCGSVVRCLDALYGNMPNPRRPAGASSEALGGGDGEGGDCVICLSKPRDVVILHCRHVCLCASCAKITSSTWSFQCPVCRGRVAAMVGLDGAAVS